MEEGSLKMSLQQPRDCAPEAAGHLSVHGTVILQPGSLGLPSRAHKVDALIS